MPDSPPSGSTPPRIAYLTGSYPAVSHTFILREVEALRTLGREVLTCSIRRPGPEHLRGPAERAAADTTFYVLRAALNPVRLARALAFALRSPRRALDALNLAWRTRRPGVKGTLWQMFYLLEAAVLAHHLQQQGVSHLHNHFGDSSGSVAMLAGALAGLPFSMTLHGPAIFFEPRLWRLDEKIARARFTVCISRFCRSQAMIFADPRHWPKLKIVHCGIDPARYGRTADRPAGKEIVFVGRLAAVKGVPVLLDAFAEVLKTHPDARLTLVGDGPERAAIEARAEALGGAVTFTGYLSQDEVAGVLARADLFALPSFAEGVPVVLMEAMASRLPVVATRIAGIPELVAEGDSGCLVPPGDAPALARALERLLQDPDLRRRMGDAGRAKVEAHHAIATEAARLDRLLA
ncbi:glycosyltransferase involved in cell wall bisynthesis [Cereibacter ovatus]|uniref:Glycosyltransferase involved in cell wall bisynthesis n=1 Tax=Cereibacter ovatus TaxID=439529 RepID=A0A285D5M4_9RHOB|nr:glycosyltransferase family 4 protein [Cereibacter ovatus]SNX74578.1 glycosyltransferase involved in cell wall bisynthesis [Cereibacter ovatus]